LWAGSGLDVCRCGPAKKPRAENEEGSVALEDERAIGEVVEGCLVVDLRPCGEVRALDVYLLIDRVSSSLAGVKLAPHRSEAVVILAAAQRTRAMPRGKRGRLPGRRAP
jgi:hypothetical protein